MPHKPEQYEAFSQNASMWILARGEKIDLSGDNRLVLLGDYMDYGPESGQTLQFVYNLQQKYGLEKVIALRGNHEEMFLEWLDTYGGPRAGEPDKYGVKPWNNWLTTDGDVGFQTFQTLITKSQWEFFQQIARTAPEDDLNTKAARMVLSGNSELAKWLRGLPYYYETQRQIFVHAGIDEEAGDWWQFGTPEHMFTGKFPATVGLFYKDIIAGHVGTCRLAADPNFHGVYYDGESHYYIDETVYQK